MDWGSFALPFRHADTESPGAVTLVDQTSPLDDGVPLQVPGQHAVASVSPSALRPLVSEDETPRRGVDDSEEDLSPLATAPPPKLPDQYHPLFRPAPPQAPSTIDSFATSLADTRPAPKPPRLHTIHDGDTLESLARRYYGDAQRASDILAANRTVLSDPEVLPIGVEIVIPRQESPPGGTSEPATESTTRNLVPLPAIGLRRGG